MIIICCCCCYCCGCCCCYLEIPAWQLNTMGVDADVALRRATIWSKQSSAGAVSWARGMRRASTFSFCKEKEKAENLAMQLQVYVQMTIWRYGWMAAYSSFSSKAGNGSFYSGRILCCICSGLTQFLEEAIAKCPGTIPYEQKRYPRHLSHCHRSTI